MLALADSGGNFKAGYNIICIIVQLPMYFNSYTGVKTEDREGIFVGVLDASFEGAAHFFPGFRKQLIADGDSINPHKRERHTEYLSCYMVCQIW